MKKNISLIGNILNEVSSYYTNKKNYLINESFDLGMHTDEEEGSSDDNTDKVDHSEDDLLENSKGNPVFKQSNGTENNFNLQESVERNVRNVIRRNLR